MTVVFDRPYQFVPPHSGSMWPFFIQRLRLVDWYLRRKEGVISWECRGLEHLKRSLDRGDGILLAPNHCRYADPLVLGWPSRLLKANVYAMASWHLFNQGKFDGFAIRKMGGFSIHREGVDRQALDTAMASLATAERPLVLFPEGTTRKEVDDLLKSVFLPETEEEWGNLDECTTKHPQIKTKEVASPVWINRTETRTQKRDVQGYHSVSKPTRETKSFLDTRLLLSLLSTTLFGLGIITPFYLLPILGLTIGSAEWYYDWEMRFLFVVSGSLFLLIASFFVYKLNRSSDEALGCGCLSVPFAGLSFVGGFFNNLTQGEKLIPLFLPPLS